MNHDRIMAMAFALQAAQEAMSKDMGIPEDRNGNPYRYAFSNSAHRRIFTDSRRNRDFNTQASFIQDAIIVD